MSDSRHLEDVRQSLKRLGYLDHGFERFLLQDALKPRRFLPTLLSLAVKVGLVAGAVLALVLSFALAAINGNLTASPFDLLPLFLHLALPISAVVAVAFLALGAALALWLRWTHVRRIEGASLAVALAAGAVAVVLALVHGRALLAELSPVLRLLLVLLIPVVAFAVVRVIYNGLLTLTIALTDAAPRSRMFRRRWVAVAILGSLTLLSLPGLLTVETRRSTPTPSALPEASGERVLLVGVDGVLPEELDFLLASGDLPNLAGLAGVGVPAQGAAEAITKVGGVLASYPRPEGPPAAFWTSLATGMDSADHGVVALDGFRPLGVTTTLTRIGPLRAFFHHLEVPLGLAEHRPLLSNRRNAFTLWELAARSGAPVLAVHWWGTFPAEPLPGLVVSHGAFQLPEAELPTAVAPAERLPEVKALRRPREGDDLAPPSALTILPSEALRSWRSAAESDAFARRVFEDQLGLEPRLAALYLAAPDVAAEGWRWGEVILAELVRRELIAIDVLLGRAVAAFDTVAVVVDPGRRGAGPGRVILGRRAGCGADGGSLGQPPELDPRAVVAGLARALGLPQSRELPDPPALCSWPRAPARVDSYGRRSHPEEPAGASDEYLETLRSLGYL